ncbi:putative Cytochrome P450 [Seiridium cardinale]
MRRNDTPPGPSYPSAADKPAFYGSWMFGQMAAMFQSLPHGDHYAKRRHVAGCNFDKMINIRQTDEKLKGETLFSDGLNPANNPPHEHQCWRVDF